MSMTKGILSGVRVLDMTRVLAGPFATMIFGDLGADVVKIENPNGGDDTRAWGPPFIEKESVYFMSINRNKRSVALNMKNAKGVDVLKKLVAKSDILVENFIPGKLDSFGLGYSDLKQINKGLIYCSITGFGPDGPLASRAGYDVVAASMGGLVNITGPAEGDPCKVGVAVTDIATGLFAQGAILTALRHKEKTGEGQKIDCDLLSTQVAVLSHVAASYLNSQVEPKRHGTAHGTIFPYQAFRCKDDRFLTVGAGNNRHFVILCKLMDLPGMSNDDKFKDNQDRFANRVELIDKLSARFLEKSCSDWLQLLEGSGLPYGPINDMKEVFSNSQVIHNKMDMEINHPSLGTAVKMPGPPVKYSDPCTYGSVSPPPLLGEHTREVLKEVGSYSDADIDQLVSSGAVFE